MSVWNEAMYYFHLAPADHRKVFVVLRNMRGELSLAQNYINLYGHLIPPGVEIWEFDENKGDGIQVHPSLA